MLPLPPGFALEDGAAFAFTYGTSHHALIDRGQLKAGETVLVLGAAGGVGTAALQIAKAAGARVIAAASTDEKCALCRQLGADETLNYSTTDVRDALKALTAGKGPDVVYDPVGGDLAEPVFRIHRLARPLPGDRLCAKAASRRCRWNLPLLKGASIVGVFWGEFVKREPAAHAAGLKQLAQWYAQGLVKPVIDQRLPMSELQGRLCAHGQPAGHGQAAAGQRVTPCFTVPAGGVSALAWAATSRRSRPWPSRC